MRRRLFSVAGHACPGRGEITTPSRRTRRGGSFGRAAAIGDVSIRTGDSRWRQGGIPGGGLTETFADLIGLAEHAGDDGGEFGGLDFEFFENGGGVGAACVLVGEAVADEVGEGIGDFDGAGEGVLFAAEFGVVVEPDAGDDAGGELPAGEHFTADGGVIGAEILFFLVDGGAVALSGFLEGLEVFGGAGLDEEDLSDVVEEAGGEGDGAGDIGIPHEFPRQESGEEGVIPEAAEGGFGFRGEAVHAAADQGEHDFEDGIESQAHHGFVDGVDGFGAAMEGGVAAFEEAGGEVHVSADHFGDFVEIGGGIPHEPGEEREHFRHRGQGGDTSDCFGDSRHSRWLLGEVDRGQGRAVALGRC